MTGVQDRIARFESVAEVAEAVGKVLGPSRWLTVDQARIDAFATITEDEQWIHVDPLRAAEGPFGSTIAHGYLTLSLVSPIVMEIFRVDKLHSAVNYGLNRVRFPAPVLSGQRVRGSATIRSAEAVGSALQVGLEVTIESEAGGRPVCVAEFLMRLVGK